jgi:RNA polymerase sigma-70 factor (ECF subfamily)
MATAGPDVRTQRQTPTRELTDGELAARVADGDRDAAGILIQRYQAMVRAFLLRLCVRNDVADDLAQDTFIRMLQYADRYDSSYPMKTWLLTIARRLWINHLRRAKVRKTKDIVIEPASDEKDPAVTVGRKDRLNVTRQKLDDAMRYLTDAQKTAVVLFHQQEMSMNEMSKVMDMPVGTVKSHLHRARATLRQVLTPDMETIYP